MLFGTQYIEMARCRFVFMPFDFPGKRKRVRESRIGARLSYIIIFIYYYYLVNLLFFAFAIGLNL